MAIDINDPARGQRALGNAYNKLLQENAGLRINIEAQELLVGELTVEIGRLSGKLEEAGIPAEDAPPPAAAKPNRAGRRRAAAKTAKADKPAPPASPQPSRRSGCPANRRKRRPKSKGWSRSTRIRSSRPNAISF